MIFFASFLWLLYGLLTLASRKLAGSPPAVFPPHAGSPDCPWWPGLLILGLPSITGAGVAWGIAGHAGQLAALGVVVLAGAMVAWVSVDLVRLARVADAGSGLSAAGINPPPSEAGSVPVSASSQGTNWKAEYEQLAARSAHAGVEMSRWKNACERAEADNASLQSEVQRMASSVRALRAQIAGQGFSLTPIEELAPEALEDYRRRLADELKRSDDVLKRRSLNKSAAPLPETPDQSLFG